MSTNFVNFARQKLNVHLEPYDISAIHDLPPDVTENALSSFSYILHEKKAELMAKRRVLKGTDIYINDHLSSYNSELFRHVRQLKR